MNKYAKLFEPVALGRGGQAKNRFMLAPMCDDSAHNGQVIDQQLAYMRPRAASVGIAVTGYAAVNDSGVQLPGQLSAAHDDDLPGLANLAQTMKAGGAKAILQLAHAGRGAGTSAAREERVYAPSKGDFNWLDYDVDEMTVTDIEQVIADFKAAVGHAIKAGFDGVEIHNCNHDLLQQFFSASANHRTDGWGGSLEKRMAFPLAVHRAVLAAITDAGADDFIIGWRISPEERHGDQLGYTVADMLAQTKRVAADGIDYLNISMNLSAGYDNLQRPDYDTKVKGTDQSFPEYFRAAVGNLPIYIGSNVLTADDALAAAQIADGVYVGREMLMDPDFVTKIAKGQAEKIINTTSIDQLKAAGLPKGFVDNYADKDGRDRIVSYRNGIPLPGLD